MSKTKYDDDFVIGTAAADENVYDSYFSGGAISMETMHKDISGYKRLLAFKDINDEKITLCGCETGVYVDDSLKWKDEPYILFTRNMYFLMREKDNDYNDENLDEIFKNNPEMIIGGAYADIPSDRWINDERLPIDHKCISIKAMLIREDIEDHSSIYQLLIKAIANDLYKKGIPILIAVNPYEFDMFKDIGFEKCFVDNLMMYMPNTDGFKLSTIEKGLCYRYIKTQE